MSAIAVGERMNHHQAMVKANGDFIGWISAVVNPVADIREQRTSRSRISGK
jgi:hypothetical protein